MTHVIKSVKQGFTPSPQLIEQMETFREIVNHSLIIGLERGAFSMKKLCTLAYKEFADRNILSYCKLCAISHAAGILTNRKKSIKRGLQPRYPYARRSLLISCYGFKIADRKLKIPLGDDRYFDIPLNHHVLNVLAKDVKVRSFTLSSDNTVSIAYSKEVMEMECRETVGLDSNLRNVTIGDLNEVVQYDLSKAVIISDNTRSIMKSFKRNDVRIRRKMYQKYGIRRKQRVNQLLHKLSRTIVQNAKRKKTSIVVEDIRHIRRLYRRGNFQARSFRGRMNGWSFGETKRQIRYKAAWEGLPVIQLSKSETKGTSHLCPQCGKKITQVDRKFRQLWCAECKRWMDRDVVAAMNLSIKGLQRFCSSQGLASEAVKGNSESVMPVILRVDASKLALSSAK